MTFCHFAQLITKSTFIYKPRRRMSNEFVGKRP
jgi:hypothetical protein